MSQPIRRVSPYAANELAHVLRDLDAPDASTRRRAQARLRELGYADLPIDGLKRLAGPLRQQWTFNPAWGIEAEGPQLSTSDRPADIVTECLRHLMRDVVVDGECVIVDGEYRIDCGPDAGTPEAIVDALGGTLLQPFLTDIAMGYQWPKARSAAIVPTATGIALHDRAGHFGDVCVTHATQVRTEKRIDGLFLVPGGHWSQLLVAARRRPIEVSPLRGLRHFAIDDATPELLHASERVRHERTIAYGCDVELLADELTLRLSPTTRNDRVLLLPFAWTRGAETLAGELIIDRRATGALSLAATMPLTAELRAAWAVAVLGAAELLCAEQLPGTPALGGTHAAAASPARQLLDLSARTFRTGRKHWSEQLEPTAETLPWLGERVVGHCRQLAPPRRASAHALANAEAHGIVLGEHQTWVQPHARGLPEGLVLRFRWNR